MYMCMNSRMAAFNLVIWCPIAKLPNLNISAFAGLSEKKVDATVLLTLEWLSFLKSTLKSKQRTLALWQPW